VQTLEGHIPATEQIVMEEYAVDLVVMSTLMVFGHAQRVLQSKSVTTNSMFTGFRVVIALRLIVNHRHQQVPAVGKKDKYYVVIMSVWILVIVMEDRGLLTKVALMSNHVLEHAVTKMRLAGRAKTTQHHRVVKKSTVEFFRATARRAIQ